MTLRQIPLRLSALLLCLALALAALAMPPMAPAAPHAHAHAQDMPAVAGEIPPDTTAPRDLACTIGCIGAADPANTLPLAGPARRVARLAHAAEAPRAAGRTPAPLPRPPRRSAAA
jgi:hypothetical protein